METILSEQEKRRKGVVEEITLLQEKVAPERESVQRIERIINRNIELENLLTTKESLINSKLDETNQKYAFYFSNMVMLDMYKVECENYRKIFKELEEKKPLRFLVMLNLMTLPEVGAMKGISC
ncbi:hypothetical protein RKK42_13120 [Klebsiella pneumoniae]|nr:hypothetical protein [Klebsiella pneumoniae]